MNITFKIITFIVSKNLKINNTYWTFVNLLSFCQRKFYRYMLICGNAEGVHGQKKFGNPFPKAYRKSFK